MGYQRIWCAFAISYVRGLPLPRRLKLKQSIIYEIQAQRSLVEWLWKVKIHNGVHLNWWAQVETPRRFVGRTHIIQKIVVLTATKALYVEKWRSDMISKGACFRCFGTNHKAKKCRKKFQLCGIEDCPEKVRYHTLLHLDMSNTENSRSSAKLYESTPTGMGIEASPPCTRSLSDGVESRKVNHPTTSNSGKIRKNIAFCYTSSC